MRRVWAVCRKELISFFASPIAYIVGAVFLLFSGYFFTFLAVRVQEAHLRYLFQNMSIILLLVCPLITMRLFAEEMKMGTFELLMTSPIRLSELVLGKFLGALLFFLVLVAVMLQYAGFLFAFGEPDKWPLLTAYVGFILMGASFLAVGVFASSLTDNQIVACIIALGILLGIWIVGWLGDVVPGAGGRFLESLSLINRQENFLKGILDTGDVLYYLSATGLFLFLTVRSLDWRRW